MAASLGKAENTSGDANSSCKDLYGQLCDFSWWIPVKNPVRGFSVGFAGAAARADHLSHGKPGMILQQLNESLAHRAGSAQYCNINLVA